MRGRVFVTMAVVCVLLEGAAGCGGSITQRGDAGTRGDGGAREDALMRQDGAGDATAGTDSASGTDSTLGTDGTVGRDASTDDGGGVCLADDRVHSGEATYYTTADGTGNCSFDASPEDLMIGAMNHVDYAGSQACGACVRLTGPNGTITIRIVDQCPECAEGDIDLSPQAFERIAPLPAGRVPITWQYISCPLTEPVRYHFKEGSNQWWTAVQVRKHVNRVAKLEYRDASGAWREVPRLSYNYFVEASGMGPGPYDFRVTDVYGHVLVDTGIPHVEGGDVQAAGQFPACQ